MHTKFGIIAVAFTLALGCGGDDAPSGGTVNESIAKQNAAQTISTVTTLMASTDPSAGQTAATQLLAVAQGAQAIITPDVGTGAGTCECAGTSCTFQDCSSGTTGNEASITGSISWGDGAVNSDMSYTIATAGQNIDLSVKTGLTVTETSINGSVKSTGKMSLEGMDGVPAGTGDVSWNNSVTFNEVTYSNGQATGGSMSVTASTTVGGKSYGGSATVQFP